MNADVLERNLYLAVQFLELGVPVILCLNMMDEVRRHGKDIDVDLLAALTGCPAVPMVARAGEGREALLAAILDVAGQGREELRPLVLSYGPDLDPVLCAMEDLIRAEGFLVDRLPARWVGLKYLENDAEVVEQGRRCDPGVSERLEEMAREVARHTRRTLKAEPDAVIADYRYGYIAGIVKQAVRSPETDQARLSLSDQLDKLLTHRVLGPVIMAGIVYCIYQVTFSVGTVPMGWVEALFKWLSGVATDLLPDGLLRSLVVSGVIGGVGGVVVFVPLIMVMFLLISALEDSGYLARMAYMLDRVFRLFGLHGTSVLPFILGGGIAGGCAVPGILASRTLRSPKEKLATLLVTPFMTCGAKVPVFLMLVGAFFPGQGARAMFLITLAAWAAALLTARALRSTVVRGEPTPFVMELPPYRFPTLKGMLIHMWERSFEYLRKAGTVILAIAILLWAAMTFPRLPEDEAAGFTALAASFEAERGALPEGPESEARRGELDRAIEEVRNGQAEAALRHSLAGRIGVAVEPLTRLAGFNWRLNIALAGGLAAKEVIVSTLATAYSLGEVDPEDAAPVSEKIKEDPSLSAASGVAMILFVLLYAPCAATLAVLRREAGARWAAFALVFNTLLAFGLAVGAYQALRAV
jgi:ferrous iron transport protein B